jgi:hypothetical protein
MWAVLRRASRATAACAAASGHPDHRLVGDVATQVVQGDARYAGIDLLYASLPTERLRTAPAESLSAGARLPNAGG